MSVNVSRRSIRLTVLETGFEQQSCHDSRDRSQRMALGVHGDRISAREGRLRIERLHNPSCAFQTSPPRREFSRHDFRDLLSAHSTAKPAFPNRPGGELPVQPGSRGGPGSSFRAQCAAARSAPGHLSAGPAFAGVPGACAKDPGKGRIAGLCPAGPLAIPVCSRRPR